MAAAAAAIAAAAIGAAGSIGGAAISAKGAKDAASGSPYKLPLPKYAQALNQQVAQALALNMGQQPPSFVDYVKSGGMETFPYIDPGISPQNARKLGLITGRGTDVPTMSAADAAAGNLNPEQLMFLADWTYRRGRKSSPLFDIGRLNTRITRLEGRPDTPRRDAREERLRGRLDDMLARRGYGAR